MSWNVGVGERRTAVLEHARADGTLDRYLDALIAARRDIAPPATAGWPTPPRVERDQYRAAALVAAMRDNATFRRVRRRARQVA